MVERSSSTQRPMALELPAEAVGHALFGLLYLDEGVRGPASPSPNGALD